MLCESVVCPLLVVLKPTSRRISYVPRIAICISPSRTLALLLFASVRVTTTGGLAGWRGDGHPRLPPAAKQGTHGDENLGEVDALLPGATFVEKEAIYVNTEGRPQR